MKETFILSGNIAIQTAKVGALKIITPAGKPVTLKAPVFSSDKPTVSISLLENYTYTDAAESTLPLRNKQRSLSGTAGTIVKSYPDVTVDGGPDAITLEGILVPVAANELKMHGEWILKPSTTYLLALSNSNAAAATIGFFLEIEE